ncbi:HalOD1 output domain-containing protein [Natronomonas gomsonensis]|uniref:HalOD1 output domain-containing protein n=1 Tax=Natronomonas gomsonensis TaxID=1046043 RepID=UPI0015BAE1A6|nr:HalOD1 output domain-containing protein [Natronomonas gomsonensis]
MTIPNRPGDGEPAPDSHSTIQTEFDWESVTPSTAVIETIAIAANTDPSEIEPLYDSVDSEALDRLIQSTGTRPTNGGTTVSFAVSEYEVSVHSDGTVAVRHITEEA